VYRAIRQSISQLNQNLQENIAGIQVVQLNRREERNLDRYSDINRENRREEDRAVGVETLYGGFMDSMASVAVGVILWFGGGSVLQETISLGSVVLFTQFIDMLFRPIVAVGEQYNVLFRAMASAERIFQALDWDESVREPENPVEISGELRGALEVRHLNFAYTPGQNVLNDVSFEISPGEKLAIVGATGSGKSTIIRLLGRFYDIESEQIFLDGVDITNIPSHQLRRRIGIVLQDFHVFSGSVADNISLGDPRISRAKVIDAARHVNAERFIGRLAQGYDTPLAERGANLSQGQRQLLAFARVLAADPEILVLDEATASIDTETELLIQKAIRTLTEGRTSIIIAHRLQTIREADRILVLNDGRVAEIGSHDELLAAGGIYRKLYSLQFQDSVAE
jgi:ATP-binding cassette subfamily B protein